MVLASYRATVLLSKPFLATILLRGNSKKMPIIPYNPGVSRTDPPRRFLITSSCDEILEKLPVSCYLSLIKENGAIFAKY